MRWLSDNYKWLFDGFAGAAIIALIAYLVQRWVRRLPETTAITSVQKSSENNSPVSSGSNNTQTVHAPTIQAQTVNYGIGPIMPTAPSPQPKAKIQKDLPNVLYISAGTVSITEDLHQGLIEEGAQQNAILIRFANEARPGAQNLSARVKAVLIYRYGQKEIDVTGGWLDEASEVIDLEPDSRRHKLIVGMVIDGELSAITARDFVAHRRYWHRRDSVPLKGFQTGTVFVQLTDIHRSDVLYQGESAISVNPLSIDAKHIDRAVRSSCDFWLAFDPRGSRPLMIQNGGDEVGFDVVVKIPADGSGFTSDVINRLDNNKNWVPCISNGSFVHLESVRRVLVETILRGTQGENPKSIPVSVSYRSLTQRNCECRLEIRLPLKNGIQFALPEK
jgi:hypothetical protein